ncbi:MFS transporter [Alicyclobacillaceae bacterium I2511]|nr:MFS transporter [Alicyclobacillaceae bacterium I2511]
MEAIIIKTKQDIFNLVNSGSLISRKSWMIVLIALGGTFIDAYDFTSLGIGAVQLKGQFHLSAFQLGSLTAIMAVGALVGALVGGYYVDKVGRLKMFMLDLVFFVVSAIAAAFSPNLLWLITFRFLMGVGVGLDFPAALSFIAEYTGIKRKGRSVNSWQMMWYIAASFGFLIIIPIYYLGVGPNLWRWAVGIGAVPAIIVLILRYMYMDESPLWAASHGDLPGAVKILQGTYGIHAVLEENSSNQTVTTAPLSSWKEYAQLFNRHYRTRTTLVTAIGLTQAMEYYTVAFYLPTISLLIFGKKFVFAILGSAVFNLFGVLGSSLNVYNTSKLGIRRLAIVGYVGVLISLITIGLFDKSLPILIAAALIALFITSHSFGPGATGMTMGAMSYPTSIRGVGSGYAQGIIRVGSIFGFYFFPLMLAALGLQHTLLLIGVAPLTGLLVTLFIKWDPTKIDIESEQI